jgi:5-methylcytosine-specific restriction endonuclease McrA
MPHPLFEVVRARYQRTCGYCGVTEVMVGGELTLDHHRPRAADGGDDQNNLVYACIRCNQYKGDFWPDDEEKVHLLEQQNAELKGTISAQERYQDVLSAQSTRRG